MADAPPLPWSYRPLGVRVMLSLLAALLLGVVGYVVIALPPGVREDFTPFQVVTLLVFLAVALLAMYALVRCRVRATDAGVEIVNGYRRRRLEWPQILKVSQRRGDPWAVLDTDAGTTVAVMAIQGSDGARARTAVRELAALVEQQTPTNRND